MNVLADFLVDLDAKSWQRPAKAPSKLAPSELFLGRGEHPLEVALATSPTKPLVEDVRKLWHARRAGRASPVLLVVGYPDGEGTAVTLCGPVGEHPPVMVGVEVGQAERLCAAALVEPNRHAAQRFLTAMLPEVGAELPGVRNAGLLASHELVHGVELRDDWIAACGRAQELLGLTGRDLVKGLGFSIEQLGIASSVLAVEGRKRVVAVFLDESETFEESAQRFVGASAVSHALAVADQEDLDWVVLTRGRQIRLYAARPDVGVGRKGRAETFVEINLALLTSSHAGYLDLLFSGEALAVGGTLDQILESSADFAADLGARLRDRVYFEVVPRLANSVAARFDFGSEFATDDLVDAYEQTLTILFRLLFVAYAEDKELLPYRTNSRYTDHALKTLARRLTERLHRDDDEWDAGATDLWDDVQALWRAVDQGNHEWGVPAYNGGLFSDDPSVNLAGAAIAGLDLTNAEFGPALTSLLVDHGRDGVVGPVDFRSLSVREFGTIYEGLLESELSVAPTDLAIDASGEYQPAKVEDPVVVGSGAVYFHNRSGARKATGSYFTKQFAVEHLLDHALTPALDAHLELVAMHLAAGDDAAASDAFFDFRCVDLAMGSGHFLVAAVDRIEARLSAFLALNPIPPVLADLERLHGAAFEALGDLGPGLEIETSTLLRRHVARRCIYGVDKNRLAVELARLAIWIHTFVPGLPLSFLDHGLVQGDSLTGIGTLSEAVSIIDPVSDKKKDRSLFLQPMLDILERSRPALQRLALLADATPADIDAAREAQRDATEAVRPAKRLFDLLVSARLGEVETPDVIDEASLSSQRVLIAGEHTANELGSLHFPIAFPEVFLRDRPGFDCIIGNPPWDEVMVDEHSFWALRFPGIRALGAAQLKRKIQQLRTERPDYIADYEREVDRMTRLRNLLSAGQYPQMNEGNADLYKAFCWRFWNLAREGGAIGVVLPRTALAGAGSSRWRLDVLSGGQFTDVALMQNNAGWAFDDVDPRYTFSLVAIRKGELFDKVVSLRGPFASLPAFRSGVSSDPVTFSSDALASWSDRASFPILPGQRSAEVFAKLREQPRLDRRDGTWRARPLQGDFNATTDKNQLKLDPRSTDGLWRVYKGASFNLWEPDTGTYYAWADPKAVMRTLSGRRKAGQRRSNSPFAEFSEAWASDPDTLPCRHPRIAFRDVTNRTNSRTVIAALVPGSIVITNQAPYLLWPEGDERDAAFLLGVLCSIPLDWYARCVVETHVNFHLFNSFPIPRPSRENKLRRRVEEIAGMLAAVDDAYEHWAEAVGVGVGGIDDPAEHDDLVAELDAAVGLLYGLDADDMKHVFETFHVGWDYANRLAAVLSHHSRLARSER